MDEECESWFCGTHTPIANRGRTSSEVVHSWATCWHEQESLMTKTLVLLFLVQHRKTHLQWGARLSRFSVPSFLTATSWSGLPWALANFIFYGEQIEPHWFKIDKISVTLYHENWIDIYLWFNLRSLFFTSCSSQFPRDRPADNGYDGFTIVEPFLPPSYEVLLLCFTISLSRLFPVSLQIAMVPSLKSLLGLAVLGLTIVGCLGQGIERLFSISMIHWIARANGFST